MSERRNPCRCCVAEIDGSALKRHLLLNSERLTKWAMDIGAFDVKGEGSKGKVIGGKSTGSDVVYYICGRKGHVNKYCKPVGKAKETRT